MHENTLIFNKKYKRSRTSAHAMEKLLKEWDPRVQEVEYVVDENGYQIEWKCAVCKDDHEPAIDCYAIKFTDKRGNQSLHREVDLCCGCRQELEEMGKIEIIEYYY